MLRLERSGYANGTIMGSLYNGDTHICYTLENEEDSIPSGVYQLEPHLYHGKTEVVALVNKDLGVTHYKDESIPNNRYAILIHPGNVKDDTKGCILVGLVKEYDRLLKSRDALALLLSVIKRHNIKTLEVK